MEMTIDEAIATIKGEKWIGCQEKYIEAINLMKNTMRKYQKIEKVLNDWREMGYNENDGLYTLISGVVEDENDD